jgi:hypothetical protein
MKDYLTGHFTTSNVEAFVNKHASSWGRQELRVQMSWGCQRLLPVTVVAIALQDDTSELGFVNTSTDDQNGRPVIVRRKSPPLGIPLASLGTRLQDEYRKHVRAVVLNDLDHYVSITYETQRSRVPERILQAVCRFFQMEPESEHKVISRPSNIVRC